MNKPLVSIGMPLYNASADVRRALDSLLAQDFKDFELIISDNASTDHTWAICQEYAGRDSRIRLYQNAENKGIIYNFQRVFDLAAGEYFMWAAHDDQWQPNFISACVEKLSQHAEVALCYTHHRNVENATGEVTFETQVIQADGAIAWERARNYLDCRPVPYAATYGLFRRAALARALPMLPFPGSGHIMLLRLVLQGAFVGVHEPLHTRTIYRKNVAQRSGQYGMGRKLGILVLIEIRFILALMRIVWVADVSIPAKIRLTGALLRFLGMRYGGFIRRLFNRNKVKNLPQVEYLERKSEHDQSG